MTSHCPVADKIKAFAAGQYVRLAIACPNCSNGCCLENKESSRMKALDGLTNNPPTHILANIQPLLQHHKCSTLYLLNIEQATCLPFRKLRSRLVSVPTMSIVITTGSSKDCRTFLYGRLDHVMHKLSSQVHTPHSTRTCSLVVAKLEWKGRYPREYSQFWTRARLPKLSVR